MNRNKNLHKKRNERTQMAEKFKEYDKKFGLDTAEAKRAVAVTYTIDCNKRGKDGSTGKEPRMTD